MTTTLASTGGLTVSYEPPRLRELGAVSVQTTTGCFFGKKLGGTDGWTFMGINMPISNCSS